MLPVPPFVLLDHPGGARLYRSPVGVVSAARVAEVRAALSRVRAGVAAGLHAAGSITYEAGAALVPRTPVAPATGPLLWFGLFEDFTMLDEAAMRALLPDPAGAWVGAPQPAIGREVYGKQLAQVLELIAAGDIYQANLTFPASVPYAGHPHALYAQLRARAAAPYAALIDTGTRQILSFSPELFFAAERGQLTCRPMKGTAQRGEDPATDRAAAAALAADPKQRAENLMIVDLMRNDLSRIAAPGSVAVPALFTVETYPTIHQLTSTVTADIADNRDAIDVIEALFPCGSITGAPKSRAMQVVGAVEGPPRGVYTGAIGCINADGDASFNVAIRTLTIAGDAATMGLGSGIVADSRADEEWAECLAKAAFVTAGALRFDLIETMAFEPRGGIVLLDRHLKRMAASAATFGFALNRHALRNDLQAATFRLRVPAKVRLVLAASGAIAIETAAMPPAPAAPLAVAVVPLPVSPDDFRLRHKTSDRAFYDRARVEAGVEEVLFEHEGALTEGSFTSIFVPRDGTMLTPALAHGLLPGILRADLIARGEAREARLTRADLAGGFLLGNALRGLMPARLVAPAAPPV